MAIAVIAGLSPAEVLALGRYPPADGGFKGSQPGSFDAAHAVARRQALEPGWRVDARDPWTSSWWAPASRDSPPRICGSKRHPSARILVLDGARRFRRPRGRNEFRSTGRCRGLRRQRSDSVAEVRMERRRAGAAARAQRGPRSLRARFDRTLYPGLGLSRGVFFTREAFGADRLVRGDPTRMVADDIPADRMNARPSRLSSRTSALR